MDGESRPQHAGRQDETETSLFGKGLNSDENFAPAIVRNKLEMQSLKEITSFLQKSDNSLGIDPNELPPTEFVPFMKKYESYLSK